MLEITKVEELRCYDQLLNIDRIHKSIGTLGGGNHFIEVSESYEGKVYLIVHTGSRNLGKQVAEIYQNLAVKYFKDHFDAAEMVENHINLRGDKEKIQGMIKDLKSKIPPKQLAFLSGQLFEDYIHDMKIVQDYASINRRTIIEEICHPLNIEIIKSFQTIHNYIDTDSKILRKGAISANYGEIALIPLNMRDGSLICIGKGNPDWNNSAPHGAGRIMSRGKAKAEIDIEDFKASMRGIYSTSVNESTLDESPFAYKDVDELIGNIGDTVDIIDHIRPVYNFKA